MPYTEENYLMLSGIQHFFFCRRQWALIHIEQQWKENVRTIDGQLMHEKAHDSSSHTRRENLLTVRGMKIHSAALGLSGECDVVEFRQDTNGIKLAKTEGLWLPYPVEYKRGESKPDHSDEAQLCAQAMCLEEMLCCDIPEGALYYGKLRHREVISFTSELREQVKSVTEEMHQLYRRGCTPKVKPKKGCNACSLKELCLPKLMKATSVSAYLKQEIKEAEGCDIC